MLKRAVIIVGLGFGDEGKGLATDFYCQHSEKPLVVRFNGGHQAGHTVVKANGMRHIFSSFGAGTLSGAPTYWSSYCTVSLAALLREYGELSGLIAPKLLLDPQCPVTTHYDVLFNRAVEATRGSERHGSCGLGFGATIERNQKFGIKLTVHDLLIKSAFKAKLKVIRSYYQQRINSETKFSFKQFDHDKEDYQFEQDAAAFAQLKASGVIDLTRAENIFSNESPWNTFVFEGAQGILLDMDFGHYPHVTRSNTTSKNALQILQRYAPEIAAGATIAYVTRCYQTRHGAGPFQPIDCEFLFANELETNVFNAYQGEFRIGPLNVDALNYALSCDAYYSKGLSKHLLVTCIDQLPTRFIPYQLGSTAGKVLIDDFSSILETPFNKVNFSFSNSADVLRWQN